ncbi:actin-like protein ARP6 [Pseudohyphozyma bogoriensis]|nr:actin-like protein ARP6 [Pseudohyphozyma bogoriensis]
MTSPRTLLFDNGAHSIKALWADAPADAQPEIFRNAVIRSKSEKRNFVADELDECADFGGLVFRLAFDRGILNNWEVEKTVWDRTFGSKGRGLKVDPASTELLITEPVFNLPNVQEHYDQMIFEEYDFASCLRCPGPALVPFGPDANTPGDVQPECVLVVDSGFSFTHIVPVVRGSVVSSGVRRIDVGGKLLTNHLKELVSFRQWYMMDQTSVMERVKETCCYVTNQWEHDWEAASASSKDTSIVRTYVLPDFVPTSSNKLGYLRVPPSEDGEDVEMEEGQPDPQPSTTAAGPSQVEEEQLLQMNNERFAVPEVLFNPSTIGLNQGGIPETIAHSIASLPEELRGMFWNNILCVGGNAKFPGPTLATILSARSALDANPSIRQNFLTRAEYQEGGSNAARRKFGNLYWSEKALREELGASA